MPGRRRLLGGWSASAGRCFWVRVEDRLKVLSSDGRSWRSPWTKVPALPWGSSPSRLRLAETLPKRQSQSTHRPVEQRWPDRSWKMAAAVPAGQRCLAGWRCRWQEQSYRPGVRHLRRLTARKFAFVAVRVREQEVRFGLSQERVSYSDSRMARDVGKSAVRISLLWSHAPLAPPTTPKRAISARSAGLR